MKNWPQHLTCVNIGCNGKRQNTKGNKETPTYRPVCGSCHDAGRGKKLYKVGVIPIKKDYCENWNGKLGFKCSPATLKCSKNHFKNRSESLQLDHIDGNNENNVPENIQTLCSCCHATKTKLEKNAPGTIKYYNRQHK